METLTMLLILLILAALCLGLATSLIHLRRRHRDARHTLERVRRERDELRWQMNGGPTATG